MASWCGCRSRPPLPAETRKDSSAVYHHRQPSGKPGAELLILLYFLATIILPLFQPDELRMLSQILLKALPDDQSPSAEMHHESRSRGLLQESAEPDLADDEKGRGLLRIKCVLVFQCCFLQVQTSFVSIRYSLNRCLMMSYRLPAKNEYADKSPASSFSSSTRRSFLIPMLK